VRVKGGGGAINGKEGRRHNDSDGDDRRELQRESSDYLW